ncbi:MAG: APC family permease [Alphaproteobacteria bacterium]|nr:APC family permease [Alphaproteobacteria bacterium]
MSVNSTRPSDEGYQANSLSLVGAVSMGTGVMIGAGIFALTGQVAELAGKLLPLAFLIGAIVTAFSAYSYIKMSNAYPSAGGIAMILQKAYGRGTVTGACAILMALSMVINESLVARTFGTYTLQLFDIEQNFLLVPMLGVGLIIFAFLVNISGNRLVGAFSLLMALAKVLGIAAFGIASLWVAGSLSGPSSADQADPTLGGFLASLALTILAYKGFTTITNSGSEVVDPHRNVGRAIIISISICVIVYLLVAFGVSANLALPDIIQAKDFALAEAARPALGDYGLWFTVALAIVATASGLIASVFAVSRMLTMLTEMALIPHRHFGMTGPLQKHLLVYTVVIAIMLTIFFDLSRIAALGAIFYLIMDIGVHWGVLRYLRKDVQANPLILVTAIVLDAIVLGAFLAIKAKADILIIIVALTALVLVFAGEWLFLRSRPQSQSQSDHHH